MLRSFREILGADYHSDLVPHATILNANGENPEVVQKLLRHATPKVTRDTYVQAVTDEKREAQNKVVKMLLPVFAGQ